MADIELLTWMLLELLLPISMNTRCKLRTWTHIMRNYSYHCLRISPLCHSQELLSAWRWFLVKLNLPSRTMFLKSLSSVSPWRECYVTNRRVSCHGNMTAAPSGMSLSALLCTVRMFLSDFHSWTHEVCVCVSWATVPVLGTDSTECNRSHSHSAEICWTPSWGWGSLWYLCFSFMRSSLVWLPLGQLVIAYLNNL